MNPSTLTRDSDDLLRELEEVIDQLHDTAAKLQAVIDLRIAEGDK